MSSSSGARLDGDQKPECGVERAGVAFCRRRREQALRTASGFGRQRRRALEEGGRRGQTAARVRAARGAFELVGDLLVGPRRRLGAVPGAAVGIELGIGDLRQRAMSFLSLVKRRRPIRRRAHQRVTKPHAGPELEQARLGCRRGSLGRDSESLGCLPHQHRFADRVGRCE